MPPDDNEALTTGERRHIGQIVHDERGAASVEWRDAPLHYKRTVLELEDTTTSGRGDTKLRRGFEPKLEIRNDDTFNPYDRKGDTFGGNPASAGPRGGKRDLKKLSEWLKMMREMEERKKKGEES